MATTEYGVSYIYTVTGERRIVPAVGLPNAEILAKRYRNAKSFDGKSHLYKAVRIVTRQVSDWE